MPPILKSVRLNEDAFWYAEFDYEEFEIRISSNIIFEGEKLNSSRYKVSLVEGSYFYSGLNRYPRINFDGRWISGDDPRFKPWQLHGRNFSSNCWILNQEQYIEFINYVERVSKLFNFK